MAPGFSPAEGVRREDTWPVGASHGPSKSSPRPHLALPATPEVKGDLPRPQGQEAEELGPLQERIPSQAGASGREAEFWPTGPTAEACSQPKPPASAVFTGAPLSCLLEKARSRTRDGTFTGQSALGTVGT